LKVFILVSTFSAIMSLMFEISLLVHKCHMPFSENLGCGRVMAVNHPIKRDTTTSDHDGVQFSTTGSGETNTVTPSLQRSSVRALQVTHKW
jgi:hypothetical protein